MADLNNGGNVMLPAPAPPAMVTLPNDQDLGGGGLVLLKPIGQTINSKGFEVLALGKEGVAYVLDPTLMGTGLSAADIHDPCTTTPGLQPVQCFQPITLDLSGSLVIDGSGGRVPPAFWGGDASKVTENFLYTAGSRDTELRYWQMDPLLKNGTFNSTIWATGQPPLHVSGRSFPYPGGATLVTWDDTATNPTPLDAVVWVVDSSGFDAKPAILLAYPALVAQRTTNQPPLKSDATNGPIANKFTVPVVVNGQVYVGGQMPAHKCVPPPPPGTDTSCPGLLVRWSQ